ncbi:hypothetical protein TraAM80_08294 [Trypanosoma rangeli]|uniref:Uncharacterized protein n=1 Tax=Trypanosoma rangeli TaxID=5698 RepID=A0A3R7KF86_TRYRA|nr:uncharacterized protein TraAM80_08294 [Trypanosoma rangeli]RNE99309.1 hypothetical protein TraAM80_08294 [Trypanosoma rangeli]|eukprot:RNE99309.1 hypothetical protein TraAM80_08294 [Trypanosoma rangeli]
MEGQKQEWSSTHAQLWTSFKRSQRRSDSVEPNSNVSIETVTPVSSVFEQHPMTGDGVASAILHEVTNRTRRDEPVFSEKLGDRIIGLIEDGRTDTLVRELLTAIIHLKNRVEKVNNEAIYRQDSLMQVANEALLHLSGQKHVDITPEEMVTEGTEALGVIESRFFAVLIQVEKCKKTIREIVENNGLDNTLSSGASMREMLDALSSSKSLASKFEGVDNKGNATLYQLMNILGLPSGTTLDQAPNLTLKLMKELEALRLENHTNSMLLLQYERAVMAKFASCGVISPPTVEQERTTLTSRGDSFFTHADDQWIMDHLKNLVLVLMEVNKNLHLNVIPNWLLGKPTEASAEAILKYMRTAIDGAREMLLILTGDILEARQSLLKMTQALSSDRRSSNDPNWTAMKEKSFLQILHGLECIVAAQAEREDVAKAFLETSHEETLKAMMRIARWLPEKEQIQTMETLNDVDRLTDYMEDAVRSLVVASTAQDPMLLRVEKLASQIARLTDPVDGAAGPNILDQAAAASLVDAAEELRRWAAEKSGASRRTEDAIIQESLHELAQLLPTGLPPTCSVGDVRIDPPVHNILDMVHLLKRRLEQWIQEQQKQQLSGAHSRLEKTRVGEVVRERSNQLVRITKEILLSSGTSSDVEGILGAISADALEGPGAASNGGASGGGAGGAISSVVAMFDDLEERLKLVKLRHHRLSQAHAADRVRLDNLIQSSTTHTRRFSRICSSVGSICRLVGLEHVAVRLEQEPKAEAASLSSSQFVLRPGQRKTHIVQPLSDADILETLNLIEELLKDNTAITEAAQQKSELLRLKQAEEQWQEEAGTFRQAMKMILLRLAEAGRRVKSALFMLGTDESAEDEVVESVIREQRRSSDVEAGANHLDGAQGQQQQQQQQRELRQQEASEESLALLLQKFGRWATRLQEAMEDHLYTQQKLSNYFADVHCFFCSTTHAAVVQNATDENLIDIDTTLMQFADGILPVLDRVIADAKSTSGNTNTAEKGGGGGGGEDGVRAKALTTLLRDAPINCVSPTNHRLMRLYESVGKLRTIVDGLLSVRYLSIPSARHRRSGGGADELKFDDAWGDTYVELDVGKLKGTATTEAGSRDAPTVSDDALFRTVEANIRSVHQALGKFSTNYKLAVILVQRDTDMMQQFIAAMLEPYSELDVDRVFKQDPVVLKEMCTLLTERTTRQRGCYFFNRVGGEGPCLWATALEQLSLGFVGILEKLRKRTQLAMELRDIVDDVVDLCATYVNWLEVSGEGEAVAARHPLPPEVLGACVRETDDADAEETPERSAQHQQRGNMKVAKPPLPPNSPQPKVSHFLEDVTTLKVIAHMFQLVQEVANRGKREEGSGEDNEKAEAASNGAGAGGWEGGARRDGNLQQLEEQVQLLREAAAVAEQRATLTLEDCKRMEQERDKALSEAAVSRAELRRWRRSYGITEDEAPPPPSQQKQQPQQQQPQSHQPPLVYPAAFTGEDVSMLAPEQRAPRFSLEAGSSASAPGSPVREALLFQLAQSVKELTEELRGASRQGNIPSHQTTTVGADGAKAETSHEGFPQAPRKQPHRNTPPRSSGLVRSPKDAIGAAPASGSISPRSAPSSLLLPSRRDNLSPPDRDTWSHTMQHHQQQRAARQESASAPRNSVVVAPKGPTYSSLAHTHSSAASGDARGFSVPRYQPNHHRGEFFNECEVCCRHHCSDHPARSAAGRFALASSRAHSHTRQLATPVSRRSRGATPSPRQLQHKAGKATTHRSQRDHSSSARRPARLWTSSARSISSPDAAKDGDTRFASALRGDLAAASAAHGDEDPHHGCDCRGRLGPTRRSRSLLSPSTSTVLSPESASDPAETRDDQYQRHPPGNAARSLTEMHGGEASSHGASLKTVGHHTAPRTSPHRARENKATWITAPSAERPTRRPNSSASKPGTRTPHSVNLRSDAVRKLADIVARTKLSGKEEL